MVGIILLFLVLYVFSWIMENYTWEVIQDKIKAILKERRMQRIYRAVHAETGYGLFPTTEIGYGLFPTTEKGDKSMKFSLTKDNDDIWCLRSIDIQRNMGSWHDKPTHSQISASIASWFKDNRGIDITVMTVKELRESLELEALIAPKT
jgi:hypothetical protein